jgi:flavin reductase (DIM6/NTAB) family NADH-FMN oxidoreductase RutF/rubredoxin
MALQRKEKKMDRAAYRKLDYTLCLLSAAANGKRSGCIINSFHQVTSSRPPKFTIAVNRDNETCKAVADAGSFCVTLLDAQCPETLINQFGYKSGRVGEKFSAYDVQTDGAGNPYLKEHMVSRVSCRVTDRIDIGNFVLFVGEGTEAELFADEEVLTLTQFTNRGKSTPPQATVYRTVALNGYRCTICGYVHEAESLPADFKCPICNAPAQKFEQIAER